MPNIKKNLRSIRAKMGLTQAEFAMLVAMPLSTYRKKENGESQFNLDEAYAISKLLGQSIEEIFFSD